MMGGFLPERLIQVDSSVVVGGEFPFSHFLKKITKVRPPDPKIEDELQIGTARRF